MLICERSSRPFHNGVYPKRLLSRTRGWRSGGEGMDKYIHESNTGRCCSTHHAVSIFFSDVVDMNARGRCSRRSLLGLAHPPVSASRLRPLGQRRIPLARFCTYPDPPRLQFSTTVPFVPSSNSLAFHDPSACSQIITILLPCSPS